VPFKISTGGADLNTVYFLDSKRGWVGGDNGHLSRTDDGGQSWVRQNVGTTAAINDIYFRDKEAGFLLAGNAIFVTRDNGNANHHPSISAYTYSLAFSFRGSRNAAFCTWYQCSRGSVKDTTGGHYQD